MPIDISNPGGNAAALGAALASALAGQSGFPKLIQKQSVAGLSTVSFTSIPQTYDELELIINLTGAGFTGIRVNNDSGANYQTQISGSANGALDQQNLAATQMILGSLINGLNVYRLKGSILDYAVATGPAKFLNLAGSASFGSAGALAGSGGLGAVTLAGEWASTAAINRLDFNFAANQTRGFIALIGRNY